VISEDVSVVDQTFPVGYDEVKSTVLPAQIVVGPEAEIIGAAGSGLIVTVVYTVD
jgi:hypothetical protein